MEHTKASITKEFPAIAAEIRADGVAEGKASINLDQVRAEARADGAKAERERIQAVQAQRMPGHEKLIEALAFDGKTTSAEAALQVLAAERAKLDATATSLEKEAPKPVPTSAPPVPQPVPDASDPKAQWAADEKLRAEFATFDDWQAFAKADAAGGVKLFRR